MKITHLIFGLGLGGIETMLVNIANEQTKKEQVSIVIINDSYDNDLINKISSQIKIIYLHRKLKSLNPFPLLKLNWLLIYLQPNIIHIHAPKIGKFVFPIFRHKIVYTIHDVGIDSKYFKYYRHFCAISKCVQMDVKSRLGIDATLIYNGIDLTEIKVKSKSSDKFRIVQISRLMHEKKGQDILIKAVALLRKKGINNICVDFIGEGKSYEYLLGLIQLLQLGNISLLGAKPYSYVKKHLCDYDLLVQPSRFEGFGLTVAEGMAAKIPVLVSANEGPMEIIDNGKYGFYFKNGNVEDCANQIEKIMNFYDSVFIEEAYEYVRENFSVVETAQKYIREYQKVLQ